MKKIEKECDVVCLCAFVCICVFASVCERERERERELKRDTVNEQQYQISVFLQDTVYK